MFYARVKATRYRNLLRLLFPNYKGRTIILAESERPHITDYWQEGHRAYPRAFTLTSNGYPTPTALNIERQVEGNPHHLNMGVMHLMKGLGLAEHVYSGTRQYLRVTLHPDEDKGDWIS